MNNVIEQIKSMKLIEANLMGAHEDSILAFNGFKVGGGSKVWVVGAVSGIQQEVPAVAAACCLLPKTGTDAVASGTLKGDEGAHGQFGETCCRVRVLGSQNASKHSIWAVCEMGSEMDMMLDLQRHSEREHEVVQARALRTLRSMDAIVLARINTRRSQVHCEADMG